MAPSVSTDTMYFLQEAFSNKESYSNYENTTRKWQMCQDIGIGKGFLDKTPKTQEAKAKIGK